MDTEEDSRICRPPNRGLILPFSYEQHWPDDLRAVVYGVAMIYCFLGVSIIADMFMSSIEEITKRRRKVHDKEGRLHTPKVWNETVANLSLMALGSSAPEIFLSVIDLFRKRMHAGDLGPFTIVGSAAFNLLVIVAVCILCIPTDEVRVVKGVPVFIVTSVFSLFAYIWLVVIVVIITPDVVDWWEALVTFMYLPLLIWLSYVVDKGCSSQEEKTSEAATQRIPNSSVPHIRCNDKQQARSSTDRRKSAAESKHQMINRITAKAPSKDRVVSPNSNRSSTNAGRMSLASSTSIGEACTQVQFLVDEQCLSSDLHKKKITVIRGGDLTCEVKVQYGVRACKPMSHRPSFQDNKKPPTDSSSLAPMSNDTPAFTLPPDVVPIGHVFFKKDQQTSIIEVERPTSDNVDDEDFEVYLGSAEQGENSNAILGPLNRTHVSVVPTGNRGRLTFTTDFIKVISAAEKQTIQVVAVRLDGCSEKATCSYHTEYLSAVPKFHYEEAEGTLEFEAGETEKSISLEVLKKQPHRVPKDFIVVLTDAEGVEFDPRDNGGDESAILTVTIEQPGDNSGCIACLDRLSNIDCIRRSNSDMIDQFKGAFFVHGSWEGQKEANPIDWVFHIIALPWKVSFTLVPVTRYFGGWACFYSSLFFIALLTGAIADFAELFGCCIGIPDLVTAITFVALGTSMPDLFASKTAATEDLTADASVVNVTGSNSVNVFLGLGLPWTIGSFYWMLRGRTPEWEEKYAHLKDGIDGAKFVVESRNLGFSVETLAVFCVFAFLLLFVRRKTIGAELGGPFWAKIATAIAFIALWFGFVGLVSWNALDEDVTPARSAVVIASVIGVEALICLVPVAFLLYECRKMRGANTEPAEPTMSPGDNEGSTHDVPEDYKHSAGDEHLHCSR